MNVYPFGGHTPVLGEGVYIAPNAAVIGDVVLGEHTSVWFSVTIRGDMFPIRIGKRTNVQDGAVLHDTGGLASTTVGDDVVIGHLALVHGTTIGNRVLIGMGAIVLDNSVIEDECIIAAGTVVPPRMHVPRRSLVRGNPGKIVRTLSEDDLLMIDGGTQAYLTAKELFRSEGI